VGEHAPRTTQLGGDLDRGADRAGRDRTPSPLGHAAHRRPFGSARARQLGRDLDRAG
jgi:hypothetical protein